MTSGLPRGARPMSSRRAGVLSRDPASGLRASPPLSSPSAQHSGLACARHLISHRAFSFRRCRAPSPAWRFAHTSRPDVVVQSRAGALGGRGRGGATWEACVGARLRKGGASFPAEGLRPGRAREHPGRPGTSGKPRVQWQVWGLGGRGGTGGPRGFRESGAGGVRCP